MTHVVDASALLAYLRGEPGGEALLDRELCFHISTVNLGEVYTKVVERGGAIEDVDGAL